MYLSDEFVYEELGAREVASLGDSGLTGGKGVRS